MASALQGKRIVVLGVGGEHRVEFWKDVIRAGAHIHMIDTADHPVLAGVCDHFFVLPGVDSDEHIEENREKILGVLAAESINVDGCFSFTERFLLITASLCEHWSLPANSPEAVLTTQSKALTMSVLHGTKSNAFTPRSCTASSADDVLEFTKTSNFPLIIKPDGGTASIGVKRVNTKEEALEYFTVLKQRLTSDGDIRAHLGTNEEIVLMEYLEGPHFEILLILLNGKLVEGFVLGNGPKREPTFVLTTHWMPSMLDQDQEKNLLDAAHQICCDVGLTNGLFNLDIVMTANGPKVLEINARAACGVLSTWPKSIYGVDVLLAGLMISCNVIPGVRCEYAQTKDVNLCRVCYNITPDRHQTALVSITGPDALDRIFKEKKNVFYVAETRDFVQKSFEKRIFTITSEASDPVTARENLIKTLEELKLEPDDEGRSIRSLLY